MLKIFGILAALCAIVQYGPYIRDILRGRTKPERAAWLIWLVLGLVIFTSQLAKGGSESLWITIVHITGNSIVFLLALKFGVGGLVRRDIIALTAAAVGIILWIVTSEPVLALLIAVAVDSIGAYLVTIKAYRDPGSETLSTWILGTCAGAFAALAVGRIDTILIVYPAYVALNSGIIVLTIIVRKRVLAGQPIFVIPKTSMPVQSTDMEVVEEPV